MTKEEFSYPYMVFGDIKIPKDEFNRCFELVLESNAGQTVIASDISVEINELNIGDYGVESQKFASIIGKALIKKGFKTGLSPHGRYYLIPKEYISKYNDD